MSEEKAPKCAYSRMKLIWELRKQFGDDLPMQKMVHNYVQCLICNDIFDWLDPKHPRITACKCGNIKMIGDTAFPKDRLKLKHVRAYEDGTDFPFSISTLRETLS